MAAPCETDDEVYKQFQDLVLDLNLDQATADEAWSNYETLKLRYVMEGAGLSWVACAVFGACRQRRLPTVGGQPGTTVQGNCVSLTRMLHYCNLTFMEFLKKKRLWMKMAHLDSEYIKGVDLLETKYAVSNNIYKKFRPIFLDLFTDPELDPPRPQRSRKQRRPPCNATELCHFCWTLYILIKGKYPAIPQDLVMSYSLLLSCIDLMYVNVRCMGRTDLLNQNCEGYPKECQKKDGSGWDASFLPESIMDYLCRKFEGVMVETKVVRDYYWKPNIKNLVEKKLLKGSSTGLSLLECHNFEHNVKEVRNAYETDLLNYGEFDDRMFLTNDRVLGGHHITPGGSLCVGGSPLPTAAVTPMPHLPKRGLLLPGDYHLLPQTPISGREALITTPGGGQQRRGGEDGHSHYSPLAAAFTALQRLHSLISGRNDQPSPTLAALLQKITPDPLPKVTSLLAEMGTRFCRLYCAGADAHLTGVSPAAGSNNNNNTGSSNNTTNNSSNVNSDDQNEETPSSVNNVDVMPIDLGPTLDFAKMRLKMAQMLFYTFLESTIEDETRRGVDIQVILEQELFVRALFTCCVELVMKCYNDPRRFPWSLQVGDMSAYVFVRIIEPVVRSEQQCDNRLSRELVNHLKMIEEQILDSLAWQSQSPLWQILADTTQGVPSCQDVNFSYLLDNNCNNNDSNSGTVSSGESVTSGQLAPPSTVTPASSVIMSPAASRHYISPRQSPLSSAASERLGLQSPPGGNKGSVKRTLLFPPDNKHTKTPDIRQPVDNRQPLATDNRQDTRQTADTRQPIDNRQIADTRQERCDISGVGGENKSVVVRSGDCNGASLNQQQGQKQSDSGADSVGGDRPRRLGSLAIFFRKLYNVANLRLCDLCDRLQIVNNELRRKIWTCLEYSIIQHTQLLRDRHLDQLIMCAVYTMCKVTREDRIFQDIMKQYRCQPQAASHIYRSVLIERLPAGNKSSNTSSSASSNNSLKSSSSMEVSSTAIKSSSKRSSLLPWKVNGTSTSFKTEERGDLIKFYNNVYVQNLKKFALKFKATVQDGTGHVPPLSPLPMVRLTPVSPRRRISATRPVFVHNLSPASSAAAASPRRPLPYYFSRSPAKDLRVINSMVHFRSGGGGTGKRPVSDVESSSRSTLAPQANKRPMIAGIHRRLNNVLDERQRSTDSSSSSLLSDATNSQLPNSLSYQDEGGENGEKLSPTTQKLHKHQDENNPQQKM